MDTLRVGVIGTGFAAHHVQGLRALKNVEIIGVCSAREERARQFAAQHNIPRWFTDYRRLLELDGLDAVTICTPVYLHKQMTLDAIDAGLHVLCEKPLAMSTAEAEEMYRRAQQKGIKHGTNFIWRFNPSCFQMKALIDQGYVGSTIFHVNNRFMMDSRLSPDVPYGWRDIKAQAKVGVLGDLGVHMVHVLQWMLGDFKAVSASMRTLIPSRRDPVSGEMRPVEVDDSTVVQAELVNGIQAVMHFSRAAAGTRGIELEVYGNEGSLKLRFDRATMTHELWGAKAGDASMKKLELAEEFRNTPTTYSRWVDAIRENRPVDPSFYEGWLAQRVIDAVDQSAAERAWVDIPAPALEPPAGR